MHVVYVRAYAYVGVCTYMNVHEYVSREVAYTQRVVGG